jgi:hypothetical protein
MVTRWYMVLSVVCKVRGARAVALSVEHHLARARAQTFWSLIDIFKVSNAIGMHF